MKKQLKIIEILEDEVVIKDEKDITFKISKKKLPKYAQVGDIVRHCEHGFFDIIDENGKFVYR